MKVEVSPYPSVSAAIAAAEWKINAASESARAKLITLGSGQAMEYDEVYAEAIEFTEEGAVGDYPLLQATIDAGYAADLETAASSVILARMSLRDALARIRKIRLEGKRSVRGCQTQEETARVREEAMAKFSAP